MNLNAAFGTTEYSKHTKIEQLTPGTPLTCQLTALMPVSCHTTVPYAMARAALRKATGLVTYALRQAGLPSDNAALKKASAWLEANQRECQIDQARWNCWRTYSLNYDREHGGKHGDPWTRMFMSDAATAFAVLALLPAE